MELKILCACGAKYKFEVEPVNQQMPWPVKCPICGLDGTAQANDLIQQALGASAVDAISVAPPSAPATASGKVPVRLHLSAAPAEPPSDSSAPEESLPPPVAPRFSARPLPPPQPASPKSWINVLKMTVTILVVVVGLAAFGHKWYKRVRLAVNVASAMKGGDESSEEKDQNLWADDATVLIIQHTNEMEIAQACVDFWQEQLNKKLTLLTTNEFLAEENQIGIIPPHNGSVQIVAGLQWPKPQVEALTQYLSQRFQTLAIETRDVDFTGAYTFAVYEQGTKKFRAEMEIQGKSLRDMEEVVKTENDAWAIEHGYKPGKQGFKEFTLADADKITQKLGIKLQNWQGAEHYLLLHEDKPAAPVRPTPAPVQKRPAKTTSLPKQPGSR